MEFHKWLERKFLEWRGDKISGSSITEFAREIGISQPLMSDWMSGRKRPGTRSIPKLAARYPDVYQALGLNPQPIVHVLPTDFKNTLYQAIENAGFQIKENHLDPDSLEAEKITLRVFKSHGFTFEKPEKGKPDE